MQKTLASFVNSALRRLLGRTTSAGSRRKTRVSLIAQSKALCKNNCLLADFTWLKCSYFRDLGIWHTSHLTTQLVTLYSPPQSVKRSKGRCFLLFCLCRESPSVSSISGARVSPQGDFLQTTQKINNAYDFFSEVGASAGRLRTRYSGQLGVSAGCSRHGSR